MSLVSSSVNPLHFSKGHVPSYREQTLNSKAGQITHQVIHISQEKQT